MVKLSDELKDKFVLDASWSNKNVNIGGGPMVNLEEIDLATATYWYKVGKLPMLKTKKGSQNENS
jgi:hypothetical protein